MFSFSRSKIPSGQSLHDALVLGKQYTASEALAAGIVHEVCPKSEMFSRALVWISKTVPPKGYDRSMLQTMKKDVYQKPMSVIGRKYVSNEQAKL